MRNARPARLIEAAKSVASSRVRAGSDPRYRTSTRMFPPEV
jgi:hypothetical protein